MAAEAASSSFESMGLDSRLLKALSKQGIAEPTSVQTTCIPLALEGKDIVARARTGSGKTYAYLLPMLHGILTEGATMGEKVLRGLILVPTRELCQQVRDEAARLAEFCGGQVAVSQLCTGMQHTALKAALQGPPDIVVATPGRIAACLRDGLLSSETLQQSLQMLVLDEADLLLSYGYEDDVRSLATHVPRRCQCLLMSATVSVDVERLKKLVLHNPVTVTITESEGENGDRGGIPSTVQQYYLKCSQNDKLLYTLALLRLQLVPTKALLFVESVEFAIKLRLFLEQFGLRSAVLNAELPQNSRLHILHEFNRGLFDYLIATDEGVVKKAKSRDKPNRKEKMKESSGMGEEGEDQGNLEKTKQEGDGGKEAHEEVEGEDSKSSNKRKGEDIDGDEEEGKGERKRKKTGGQGTGEFGVVRGIDFKAVRTVINISLPSQTTGYIHRVGRTGRAGRAGWAVSLVSPSEEAGLESIEADLAGPSSEAKASEGNDAPCIRPFPLLSKNAVEALRYRAEDVAKGVTRAKIREARTKELRLEMLNSERLKAHFEDNPNDRELLQHDKVLTRTPMAPHLKSLPGYLRDSTTDAASRAVKAAQLAVGKADFAQRRIARKKAGATKDPLKSFAFAGRAKGEDELPEVAKALAGTLWARKKQKEKGTKKSKKDTGSVKGEESSFPTNLGKFQSSKKHSRRKR